MSLSTALPAPGSRELVLRQFWAIVRFELRRHFLSRRFLLLYAAALLPVSLVLLFHIAPIRLEGLQRLAWLTQTFGITFQTFTLRMLIFFGTLWAFLNLFRGEVLDRSLHYYLLCPVRRELLTAAKYVAGVIGTFTIFGLSTLVSFVLLYLPFGVSRFQQQLFDGPALGHLGAYLGITFLACCGYGALALLLGLRFTNPVLPALILFGWESIEVFLPEVLKRISIIHYLKSLGPVQIPHGPFAVVGDPPAAWVSVLSVLVLSVTLVAATAWLSRRLEVRYGDD